MNADSIRCDCGLHEPLFDPNEWGRAPLSLTESRALFVRNIEKNAHRSQPDIFRVCECAAATMTTGAAWPHIHLGGPTHHYGVPLFTNEEFQLAERAARYPLDPTLAAPVLTDEDAPEEIE